MKLTKEQRTNKENTVKAWKNDLLQLEMNLEIFELAKKHVKRKLETDFYMTETDSHINQTKEQIGTMSRNVKALQMQLKENNDGS